MCVQAATDTCVSDGSMQSSSRCHHNGPAMCPCVVVTSSPLVDGGPSAVDLSVYHADDLPLNLSATTSSCAAVFQSASDPPPPPAHCHVTGGPHCLSRLPGAHWTLDTPSSPADDSLRSLDVLSAAAALRSEMSSHRLTTSSSPAAVDAVTLSSLADRCRQVSEQLLSFFVVLSTSFFHG